VSYFSGIVDEHDAIRLGGYPGAFRELLGVRSEEFHPLLAGETVRLDDGATASVWLEDLALAGAEAAACYADGPLAGTPAVTRHAAGEGVAWYVATRLDDAATERWVAEACAGAGVAPAVVDLPPRLEAVRRRGPQATYLFLINHADEPAAVPARGTDLLTGRAHDGMVEVPAGGVAVVREAAG
jgi:beta-galactosidase